MISMMDKIKQIRLIEESGRNGKQIYSCRRGGKGTGSVNSLCLQID